MILSKQFIISFLSLTQVYFIVAAILDTYINSEIANIIGLILDLVLDFMVQHIYLWEKSFP